MMSSMDVEQVWLGHTVRSPVAYRIVEGELYKLLQSLSSLSFEVGPSLGRAKGLREEFGAKSPMPGSSFPFQFDHHLLLRADPWVN